MSRITIIGLFPLTGNGGIASWTKEFISSFPDDSFHIIPVNIAPERRHKRSIYERIITGLRATRRIMIELSHILSTTRVDILHTTTGGSIGAFRDLLVVKLCRKHKVRTIMHCRYGCVSDDYKRNGLVGWLLRKSMSLFDQVWVLDQQSFIFLKTIDSLKEKVYLIPNSINVKDPIDLSPKEYKRIAFVGNLVPTKGLFELTKAAISCDVRLDIIGPGYDDVLRHLEEIVGDQMNRKVFIHGSLSNSEAVKFMPGVYIIALPTYYASEAFPISILEAMSLTKMVISCPRAAIPDMLTDLDGNICGKLVQEKSVDEIIEAILWCQVHKEEADQMCRKAYEKVYNCYRTEIVYNVYREHYKKLCGR